MPHQLSSEQLDPKWGLEHIKSQKSRGIGGGAITAALYRHWVGRNWQTGSCGPCTRRQISELEAALLKAQPKPKRRSRKKKDDE